MFCFVLWYGVVRISWPSPAFGPGAVSWLTKKFGLKEYVPFNVLSLATQTLLGELLFLVGVLPLVGYFKFGTVGLFWSYTDPVFEAAALLAAAGRDCPDFALVCGFAGDALLAFSLFDMFAPSSALQSRAWAVFFHDFVALIVVVVIGAVFWQTWYGACVFRILARFLHAQWRS